MEKKPVIRGTARALRRQSMATFKREREARLAKQPKVTIGFTLSEETARKLKVPAKMVSA